MSDWTPTLPGLALPTPGAGLPTPIRDAATASLAALDAAGALEPRHAVQVQLILGLADAVDRGLMAPKVTIATATLARQLQDAIAALPVPEVAKTTEFDAIVRAMRAEGLEVPA